METVVVACGLLLLPLLPLVAAVVASDRMFLQDYPAAMARIARHIRATWRGRAISRMLEHRLTPPRLRKHHDVVGACTHCGNCCLDRACVFLSFDEQGRSHCQIYGGRLWRRLSCGDYPIDASEIELYRCPSFSAVVAPVPSAGRVIPIVRVGNPPRSGG